MQDNGGRGCSSFSLTASSALAAVFSGACALDTGSGCRVRSARRAGDGAAGFEGHVMLLSNWWQRRAVRQWQRRRDLCKFLSLLGSTVAADGGWCDGHLEGAQRRADRGEEILDLLDVCRQRHPRWTHPQWDKRRINRFRGGRRKKSSFDHTARFNTSA